MAIAMTDSDSTTRAFEFTAADVAALPSSLPSGDVKYELNNGRLIAMPPPGNLHGAYQNRLAFELTRQGEKQGHGVCRVESGIILWKRPDRVVGPDAMFVTNKQLPIQESPEGYLLTIPELVVEIRSKNERDRHIQEKVRDYFKAGVQVLWLVEPDKRVVIEHRAGGTIRTFAESDTLMVEDFIPGFRMRVADVFQE